MVVYVGSCLGNWSSDYLHAYYRNDYLFRFVDFKNICLNSKKKKAFLQEDSHRFNDLIFTSCVSFAFYGCHKIGNTTQINGQISLYIQGPGKIHVRIAKWSQWMIGYCSQLCDQGLGGGKPVTYCMGRLRDPQDMTPLKWHRYWPWILTA